MKKVLSIWVFLLSFLVPACLLAQDARIIDLKGEVMIKSASSSAWQKAKVGTSVKVGAELETKADSICTLAFDSKQKNILSIKENSRIKLNNPGDVSLPQGRVFALMENLSAGEKFEIRTPTAIAGARGTGWVTEFNLNKAKVSCMEDTVYLSCPNASGAEKDLSSGYSLNVSEGCLYGALVPLDDADNKEWMDFKNYAYSVTGQGGGGDNQGGIGPNTLDELREEQSEDFGDIGSETRRENAIGREEEDNNETPEPEPPEEEPGGPGAITPGPK